MLKLVMKTVHFDCSSHMCSALIWLQINRVNKGNRWCVEEWCWNLHCGGRRLLKHLLGELEHRLPLTWRHTHKTQTSSVRHPHPRRVFLWALKLKVKIVAHDKSERCCRTLVYTPPLVVVTMVTSSCLDVTCVVSIQYSSYLDCFTPHCIQQKT